MLGQSPELILPEDVLTLNNAHPCILARSVAIMSDAAHMLSDVAGLGVSIFATWAASRRSHISYR